MRRLAIVVLVGALLCLSYAVWVEAGGPKTHPVDSKVVNEMRVLFSMADPSTEVTYKKLQKLYGKDYDRQDFALVYSNLRIANEIKAASERIEKAIRETKAQ